MVIDGFRLMNKNAPGVYYIGIDPGLSGGIAMLSTDGQVIGHTKMPATERDIHDWLRERLTWYGNAEARAHAVLENVHAFPKMGVCGAFTFGKGYGVLLGLLTALEVPFDHAAPAKWQALMQCSSRGDKNITKRRAQQIFPKIPVTHAIADALLIAEYGRRMQLGLFTKAPSATRGSIHGEEKAHTETQGTGEAGRQEKRREDPTHERQRQDRGAQATQAAQRVTPRHGARAVPRTRRVLRGHLGRA